MSYLRTIVEIEEENISKKEKYYLLHWGLEITMYDVGDHIVPASYTVGVCQHIITGRILTFLPHQITVIGKEVK